MTIIFSSTIENNVSLILSEEEKPTFESLRYSLYLTNDVHSGFYLSSQSNIFKQVLKIIVELKKASRQNSDLHMEQVKLVNLLIENNGHASLKIASKIFKKIIGNDKNAAAQCLEMLLKNNIDKKFRTPVSVGHAGTTLFGSTYSISSEYREELIKMATEILAQNAEENGNKTSAVFTV